MRLLPEEVFADNVDASATESKEDRDRIAPVDAFLHTVGQAINYFLDFIMESNDGSGGEERIKRAAANPVKVVFNR
jgi:hypothetical protein